MLNKARELVEVVVDDVNRGGRCVRWERSNEFV